MYQNPEPSNEMLQVFDESGKPTGALPRAIVKAEPRIHWCAVVNIWLVNAKGEILCSKRSKMLSGNPDKWQTYFGGHVKAGQTFADAAVCELNEEVGLTIDASKLFLVSKGTNPPEIHSHFESYLYPFDGEISELRFNDGEIVEARWLSLDDYLKERRAHPETWCNGINAQNEEIIRGWMGSHL